MPDQLPQALVLSALTIFGLVGGSLQLRAALTESPCWRTLRRSFASSKRRSG